MSTNSTPPTKICTRCGKELPSTTEYFHVDNSHSTGLKAACKECRKDETDQYYTKNKDRIKERTSKYAQENKEATQEYQRAYYLENYEDLLKYHQEYRDKNRERINKGSRKTYKKYRNKYLKRQREYNKKHPEKKRKQDKEYARNNPKKIKIIQLRRRARKRNLPDTFTVEEWEYCLEYFNYTCPVCGNQLRDLFGNVPHADHWIPISYDGDDNPGTVATNMVCLCQTCNFSKNSKLPNEWLEWRYGASKAKKIQATIEEYFREVSD